MLKYLAKANPSRIYVPINYGVNNEGFFSNVTGGMAYYLFFMLIRGKKNLSSSHWIFHNGQSKFSQGDKFCIYISEFKDSEVELNIK